MRLTTGGVLRGLRAERSGSRVTIVSAAGSLSVPASKVVSIREVASSQPDAGARLNVEGAASPRVVVASGSSGPPVLDMQADGSAWSLETAVAPLVMSGDLRRAEDAARTAVVARPADPVPAVALGEILLAQGRPSDAASVLRSVPLASLGGSLRRARDLALAEALTRLQRVDEAAAVLSSTPEDSRGSVAGARARLATDAQLEDRPVGSSPHFVLVAPPEARPREIDALLRELESMHASLRAELGGAPPDRITVLIYPGTEFWEATGMGSAVGALYDGRMRIPAQRLQPPSPALLGALRHEMAHAFVEALSGSRADTRWHEGLAEHLEGADCAAEARAVAASCRASAAWPPAVTHGTSHARLDWFVSRWGMQGVRDVLRGMASRGTIDAAVRAATGLGETELDAQWRKDLLAEKP